MYIDAIPTYKYITHDMFIRSVYDTQLPYISGIEYEYNMRETGCIVCVEMPAWHMIALVARCAPFGACQNAAPRLQTGACRTCYEGPGATRYERGMDTRLRTSRLKLTGHT